MHIPVRNLADIHAIYLSQAAAERIRGSPYFPKVSELRELALKQNASPTDYLHLGVNALTRAFFVDGTLDADEWESLALLYERSNAPERAAWVRQRLSNLQTRYDSDGNLKEECRQKYLEWEN